MAVRKLELAQWLVNTAYAVGYKLVRLIIWLNDRNLRRPAMAVARLIHLNTTIARVLAARLRVSK